MTHGDRDDLDEVMAAIASESGTALSSYPRPGMVVRQIVLRDLASDRGSQFEIAQVETDGNLRITSKDTGLPATEHFGAGIICYEWVYIVPPEKIASLRSALAAGSPPSGSSRSSPISSPPGRPAASGDAP